MPKILSILLIILLCTFGFAHTLSAAPTIVVDGKPLNFGLPIAIENDRLLIPLRAVLEFLGARVDWNPHTQMITVSKGSTRASLVVGDSYANCNGEIIHLDTPARLIEGRAMVPLRFISESFGMTINWVEFDRDHQLLILRNPLIAYKTGLLHNTSRQTRWGQSIDQVMASEPSLPYDGSNDVLLYSSVNFEGVTGDLGYFFVEDALAMTIYDFHGEEKSAAEATSVYNQLTSVLNKQYGKPVADIAKWDQKRAGGLHRERIEAVSSGELSLFTAWMDEYTMICLFLNDAGKNLGMVFSDIDRVDNNLISLLDEDHGKLDR